MKAMKDAQQELRSGAWDARQEAKDARQEAKDAAMSAQRDERDAYEEAQYLALVAERSGNDEIDTSVATDDMSLSNLQPAQSTDDIPHAYADLQTPLVDTADYPDQSYEDALREAEYQAQLQTTVIKEYYDPMQLTPKDLAEAAAEQAAYEARIYGQSTGDTPLVDTGDGLSGEVPAPDEIFDSSDYASDHDLFHAGDSGWLSAVAEPNSATPESALLMDIDTDVEGASTISLQPTAARGLDLRGSLSERQEERTEARHEHTPGGSRAEYMQTQHGVGHRPIHSYTAAPCGNHAIQRSHDACY